jgi:hypothetical protein
MSSLNNRSIQINYSETLSPSKKGKGQVLGFDISKTCGYPERSSPPPISDLKLPGNVIIIYIVPLPACR